MTAPTGAHAPVLLATLVMLACCPGAHAAVRTCKPPVTSDIVEAETEQAGKRKALQSWTLKASAFGVGYTSWQLATNRALVCKSAQKSGVRSFACVATAAPCTIQQAPDVPGARPADPLPRGTPTPPRRRLVPLPGRNVPFEV